MLEFIFLSGNRRFQSAKNRHLHSDDRIFSLNISIKSQKIHSFDRIFALNISNFQNIKGWKISSSQHILNYQKLMFGT